MSASLGLSVGVANLVGARVGSAPVSRTSVLTLFDDREAEVGLPEENPRVADQGLALRGFVEHVGQAPLTAPDGAAYRGAALTAQALGAMARTVGPGAPVTIAVPAHWSGRQCAALREAVSAEPALMPDGAPPAVISDATTALAALYAKPGFPRDGVVVLCDFGAGGTNVTLADAASNYQQIGPAVHHTGFSGDKIDQLILTNLAAGGQAGHGDHEGTAPLAPLSRRLGECRRAKEELSAATVTVVPAALPGFGHDVRISRAEFEGLISAPLDRFIAAVEDVLQRNGVPRAGLAAAAIVGGGACIPLLTARLSDRLRVPVFTTPQPMFSAAVGAAVLGQQRSSAGPVAPGGTGGQPPDRAGAQSTDIAPAGWAIRAANDAAGESAVDDDQSATYRALAWSQDPGTDADPVPPPEPAEPAPYAGGDDGAPAEPARWYTRPTLLMGAAGAAAVALLGVVVAVAFKLTTSNSPTAPPTDVTSKVEPSASGAPSSAAPAWTPPTTTIAPTRTWATARPTTTVRPTTTARSTTTPPPTTTSAGTTTSTGTTTTAPATTTTGLPPLTSTSPQETVTLPPVTPTGPTLPGGF